MAGPEAPCGPGGGALSETFQAAMRAAATTVALVTTRHGPDRHVLTATSVASLSLAPPSLLICLNRASSAYPAFLKGAGFCVNFLATRHQPLARLCSQSGKGEAPFVGDVFVDGTHGMPVLADAMSAIVCAQDGRYLHGAHAIIIGRVISVDALREDAPLLYWAGSYL